MKKNAGFLKARLLCMSSNSAVADESEQQEIVLQRSFDSSSSSDNNHNEIQPPPPPPRKYVSLSEMNHQSVEMVRIPHAAAAAETIIIQTSPQSSYNVVDLDDEVSSDNSSGRDGGGNSHTDADVVVAAVVAAATDTDTANEFEESYRMDDTKMRVTAAITTAAENDIDANSDTDVITVCGPSNEEERMVVTEWNHITQQIHDELNPNGGDGDAAVVVVANENDDDDDRTQGSDNSKCSLVYNNAIPPTAINDNTTTKKKKKKRTSTKATTTTAVLPYVVTPESPHGPLMIVIVGDAPVLDKTPSTMMRGEAKNDLLLLGPDNDNTTSCTWSESADSSIPTVIYIRRDIPSIVPDDEALGQNQQQALAIQQYNHRMNHNNNNDVKNSSRNYFMRGLRLWTTNSSSKQQQQQPPPDSNTDVLRNNKHHHKIHLDDDASEAFQQTLIDI